LNRDEDLSLGAIDSQVVLEAPHNIEPLSFVGLTVQELDPAHDVQPLVVEMLFEVVFDDRVHIGADLSFHQSLGFHQVHHFLAEVVL
jgi:hypothetical protein